MSKFCRYCGAPVREKAIFCSKCGKSLKRGSASAENSAPEQNAAPVQIAAPIQNSVPVRNFTPVQTEKVPREKSSGKIFKKPWLYVAVSLVLVAVILVQGIVSGWLFRGPSEPASSGSGKVVAVNENEMKNLINEDADASVVNTSAVAAIAKTEDLKISYSQDEINAAEPKTAAVSPDNPVADLGDVKVDFGDWNLDKEDEFSVRKLAQKDDAAGNGGTFIGYDFSLKSGKNKFGTRVAVTIPRTASDGELGKCVIFNSDTGKWEDVKYDVSEDGKSYTFYTTHFCPGGEVLKYIVKDHKLQLNKDGKAYDLDHGVFKEIYQAGENRMNWAVDMDTEILWNLYSHIDKNRFNKTIEDLKKELRRTAAVDEIDYIMSSLNDFFGKAALTHDMGVAVKELLTKLPVDSPYANKIAGITVYLLIAKMMAESDKKNESFAQTLWNNKEEISVTITALIVGAKVSNAAGLIISGSYYLLNKYREASDDYQAKYITKRVQPDAKDVYTIFYNDVCKGVYFDKPVRVIDDTTDFYYQDYTDKKGNKKQHKFVPDDSPMYRMTASMEAPASMETEEYERLKKVVNATYDDEEGGGLFTFIRNDRKKKGQKVLALSSQWGDMMAELVRIYPDDPEAVEIVLDEIINMYVRAFWNMSDKEKQEYFDSVFIRDFTYEDGYKDPSNEEYRKITNEFAQQVKAASRPMLQEAFETVYEEEQINLEKEFKEETLKILNTKLVFKVNDKTSKNGSSFQSSKYCVDWRSLDNNNDYANGSDKPVFNSSSFKTPMRFANVSGPAFMPLTPDGKENDVKNFYPYKPSFTPRANSNNNTVYTCTYYHYLMMGAPKSMEFIDVKGSGEVQSASINLPDMDGTKDVVEILITLDKSLNGKTFKYNKSFTNNGWGNKEGADTKAIHKALSTAEFTVKDNKFTISGSGSLGTKDITSKKGATASASAKYTITGTFTEGETGTATFSATATEDYDYTDVYEHGSYGDKTIVKEKLNWTYKCDNIKIKTVNYSGAGKTIELDFTSKVHETGSTYRDEYLKFDWSNGWFQADDNPSNGKWEPYKDDYELAMTFDFSIVE